MTSKLIFTCASAFMGLCIPAAQASDSMFTSQAEQLNNTISLLEQTAIFALTGAVILMSIAWVFYIWKECTSLKKPQKNSAMFLILVVGLGLFCSSCSVEQRAMTARYRTAEAAERTACPSQHHYGNTPLNNHFPPSYSYSNGHSPSFCKYCGQRVSNRH
jgi:hypothetical protein